MSLSIITFVHQVFIDKCTYHLPSPALTHIGL